MSELLHILRFQVTQAHAREALDVQERRVTISRALNRGMLVHSVENITAS